MVQFAPINFGLIIAYILPGTVAVYGLRYLSPRIDALWSTLEGGQIVLGPLSTAISSACLNMTPVLPAVSLSFSIGI